MTRRGFFSAVAASFTAQIVPQGPITPAEIAKREKEIGQKWCRDKVFWPDRIVIPYGMSDKIQVQCELDSQSFMTVATVKQIRDQAEDIHHGKRFGFVFGKQDKC